MQPVLAGSQDDVVRAIRAMEEKKWSLARKLTQDSGDPVAAKIYTWMYFRDEDSRGDYTLLAQFIRKNPHWPGMGTLQEKAEMAMPAGLPSDAVVAWFKDYPPETAAGLDRYVYALLGTGRQEEAKKQLAEWWAEKLSTRDDQKRIYLKYGRLIDMDAHRRRLDRLLFSEQYTNARAIAQVLGKGYPELAEARIALAEEKPGASGLLRKVPASLLDDPGLMYERLRWRRRNDLDVEAIQILNAAPPMSKIQNPEDWWTERHIMIRRLLEKKRYESAYLLASKHRQAEGLPFAEGEWLSGWLALRFLHAPDKAYKHFEALYKNVKTPVSKARGAYWAGRAASALKDQKKAREWYAEAARYQTVFYGQMAGAQLGLAVALPNASAPQLDAQDMLDLNGRDLIRAAKFFNAAGMKKESGRFLDRFVDNEKTPKAYRFAAELAVSMRQYYEAVKISKEATNQGMFLTAQSYPVIADRLSGILVEWALIHSVIRQESMFDPEARSPAGALGMMQLMPSTARHIAKKVHAGYSAGRLGNPDYNIQLGTYYLQELLDKYNGSYPLAIAAYNGGPGRVDQWLRTFGDPRRGDMDMIDWIEMMPVAETRNYVQRVMESVYIYRLRLTGIQKPPQNDIHIAFAGQY